MPEEVHKPHRLNVDGPFYVEDGCCLTCDVPRLTAPDMFKYTEDTDGRDHCFVHRQPKSAEDFARVIEVLQTQDLFCIRCRSRDGALLSRLAEHGLTDICDFKA